MTIRDFLLPDLGEGLTESELVALARRASATTSSSTRSIAEVETAKAIVELPSPFAGIVSGAVRRARRTVNVGGAEVSFEVEVAAPAAAARSTDPAPTRRNRTSSATARARERTSQRRARRARAGADGTGGRPVSRRRRAQRRWRAHRRRPTHADARCRRHRGRAQLARGAPRSTPPVRKLAHDLGVDLAACAAPARAASSRATTSRLQHRGRVPSAPVGDSSRTIPATDALAAARRDTRIPIKGVRKPTAAAMVPSAFTRATRDRVSHGRRHGDDRTRRAASKAARSPAPLGMLSVVAKALCIAVARNPASTRAGTRPRRRSSQFAAGEPGHRRSDAARTHGAEHP